MKSIIMTMVLMASFTGSSQIDLSDYKYVVVPKRFDSFKEVNQYRTSTLVKYLFGQKGFTTVYDDNLPEELYDNRCLGLFADLIDDSSMFTTKTSLVLKDCKGEEVRVSQQGRSKKKGFEEAFNEAIHSAFNSFTGLNYSYKPKVNKKQEKPITVSFKNDVKTVEENANASVEQVATKEIQSYKDRTPVTSDYKKAAKNEKILVEQKTSKDASLKNQTTSVVKLFAGILYAQEVPNGYQLVDSTPKIQLKMYKSSMPNVYVAKADDNNGVVYTSDGKWFFEYYKAGNMVIEELNIKF